MASIDMFTIVGLISAVALVTVMFTLCKLDGGCNKPNC